MIVEVLNPARHPALLAFLDRPDQGFCYCRFWFHAGHAASWLAGDPAVNRAAMARALGDDFVWALVAVEADTVIGYLRLAPSADVIKLNDPTTDAASILCMSVADDRRGQGVARALVEAAEASARERGYRWLHAHPRPERDLDAGAVWTGPRRLFEARGYAKLREGERRWTYALPL